MKNLLILVLLLTVAGFVFNAFCGIFIVRPAGFLTDGATIVYWRGDDVPDMSFISSADAMTKKTVGETSTIGRGLALAALAKPVTDNEIARFEYSDWLYKVSMW